MVNLYFYIPYEVADDIVFSGLSLSKWANREGFIMGSRKKCITALLNPRDDLQKYDSSEYKCLKLTAPYAYCRVADNYLYEIGEAIPEIMDMYWKNVIPVDEYKFGTFIKPEALITATVIPGRVTYADKKADAISLISDNRELYLSNHLEELQAIDKDIKNKLLYHYFKNLTLSGKYVEYSSYETGSKTIFIDSEGSYLALDRPFGQQC